ncbi:recombinase family protein [Streptomyces chartreusis]|uniref:recombinase family protein n=1 Tax=Streptomyces chartreusis TaxID=1969 RepID=UPI003867CFE2|nr:recombinase family protein [Streptomyces chartreusis]
MADDLVQRAHWGDLEGQNWAGLARLSTEEAEGELSSDDTLEGQSRHRFMTGRDIKSTEEQERDGRQFVESRGGRYVYTYMEPDTSAWKRRRVRLPDGSIGYRVVRPVYEGALEDLKQAKAPNGERIDGLIVYDIDRLTRDPRHLEDAIETVEHYHRPIIDITGTLDLLTDNGRAMARVVVAMANKQSADTARRVRRNHKARRDRGIPVGGTRPFGWQEDKRTLNPAEAQHIREAVRRIILGVEWHAIVADWNRQGVTTSKGNPWTWIGLRDMMRNPRLCGFRSHVVIEFDPESGREIRRLTIAHDDQGKPVTGQWTPILEVAEWEAVQEIVGDGPMRGGGRNARVYLATGTLRCGKQECGSLLRAMKATPSRGKPEGYFYYVCPAKTTGRGCGGVKVPGPETDELIRKLVIAKYEQEASQRQAVKAPQEWPKEAELALVREDLSDLKRARRERKISAERYYSDLAEYEAEEQRLKRERNAWQRKTLADQGEPVDMAEEWHRKGITLAERRSYVARTLTALVALPVGSGRRVPLRDRLVPVWADN